MESVKPIPPAEPRVTCYPSLAHRSMRDWIARVAHTDLPVLIQGESGSGKERVSRELHAASPRHTGPFVAVNCTALTESLLQSELFGAVRGAYTGADRDRSGLFRLAHGGTLLLDEVGDMSAAMQVQLLRVLEEGRIRPVGGTSELPVDVRIVTATHHDLADLVGRRRFREDLYYRLAVLQVHVPPLRERLEDLPQLVSEVEARLVSRLGPVTLRLTPQGWLKLRGHTWPGNVRELHSVLARALLLADFGEIDGRHLETSAGAEVRTVAGAAHEPPLERGMIETALAESDGRIAWAAERIGWSRQKLYRRMAALGLRPPTRRSKG